jgi:hypothetical protein
VKSLTDSHDPPKSYGKGAKVQAQNQSATIAIGNVAKWNGRHEIYKE